MMNSCQSDYMIRQTFLQWFDYLNRVKEIRKHDKRK